MNHLKAFENYKENDTLTSENLTSIIDDIFLKNDIENIAIELTKIKKKYPEISTDLNLRQIYLNYSSKWRNMKHDKDIENEN